MREPIEAENKAHGPDLSTRSREDRVRVAIALTKGATWRRGSDPISDDLDAEAWRLGWYAVLRDNGDFVHTAPDPLTDASAWGGLVETERVHLQPAPDSSVWYATTHRDGLWHDGDTPGEAVCAAVLAKRGSVGLGDV